eukprot:TRINITY_DN10615_c0_g1_i1.p1 TRINITY_DN10615_c0_g1~~TRINITY_DN10615_c0_g1_i1.p1  ORF type:complete len:489 (+),score=15.17 TRINITY_DN10615_c0_g1_i1:159-1469(+)
MDNVLEFIKLLIKPLRSDASRYLIDYSGIVPLNELLREIIFPHLDISYKSKKKTEMVLKLIDVLFEGVSELYLISHKPWLLLLKLLKLYTIRPHLDVLSVELLHKHTHRLVNILSSFILRNVNSTEQHSYSLRDLSLKHFTFFHKKTKPFDWDVQLVLRPLISAARTVWHFPEQYSTNVSNLLPLPCREFSSLSLDPKVFITLIHFAVSHQDCASYVKDFLNLKFSQSSDDTVRIFQKHLFVSCAHIISTLTQLEFENLMLKFIPSLVETGKLLSFPVVDSIVKQATNKPPENYPLNDFYPLLCSLYFLCKMVVVVITDDRFSLPASFGAHTSDTILLRHLVASTRNLLQMLDTSDVYIIAVIFLILIDSLVLLPVGSADQLYILVLDLQDKLSRLQNEVPFIQDFFLLALERMSSSDNEQIIALKNKITDKNGSE